MEFRKTVTEARIGHPTPENHRFIDLNRLGLKPVNLSDHYEKEALKQSLKIAAKERLPGYVLHFKNGHMVIVSVKTGEIPITHPQIVKQVFESNYYIMRSHTTV